MNPDFLFTAEQLTEKAASFADEYQHASPFPHIILDDLFPRDALTAALNEFPKPGDIQWASYRNDVEHKLACEDETMMGPAIRHVLNQCNSSLFLQFLEKMTGIGALIPDPHFRGGGMHQIEPGGYLKVHADFNWYQRLKLHRRLNLLVYLNQDWSESYGGHLQLWDRTMSRCEAKIIPIFNRSVIFSTTDTAYHGHPDPLTCPPDRTRKSLALYYYTRERPQSEESDAHSTLFRPRPGESWSNGGWKGTLKRFVPPIVTDAVRALRRRT